MSATSNPTKGSASTVARRVNRSKVRISNARPRIHRELESCRRGRKASRPRKPGRGDGARRFPQSADEDVRQGQDNSAPGNDDIVHRENPAREVVASAGMGNRHLLDRMFEDLGSQKGIRTTKIPAMASTIKITERPITPPRLASASSRLRSMMAMASTGRGKSWQRSA